MKEKKKLLPIEEISFKFTNWVGTPTSIVAHTFFFVGIFSLHFWGYTLDNILLVLTTIVSLEAIYLAIFIQMTINRNTESLKAVEEDVEEIAKDVDEIQEDVEEIEEDIDEIQEDVEELEEDVDVPTKELIEKVEMQLNIIMKEMEQLKKNKK